MSSLLEVLKDKQSRKPIIRLLLLLGALFVFVFLTGFFAAFVYNSLFPDNSREIQKGFNNLLNLQTPKDIAPTQL